MGNRRYSEISQSEDSDAAPPVNESSNAKNATVNNHSSSDQSSTSSSDSEERGKPPPPIQRKESSISPNKIVTANPLERFIKENRDLTRLTLNNEVTENDDVCLLEVPKTIDVSEFMGKCINFDKKTKLKLNKIKYVIKPSLEDIRPISLLTRSLKVVHPVSILKLHAYTKVKSDSEAIAVGKYTPSLPDNLKVRHPLFGTEYKHKIVLDEHVQKKLDSAIEKAVKKMGKKKKKHQEEVSSQELNDSGKKKKKKKKNEVHDAGLIFNPKKVKQENFDILDQSIFALLESHITENRRKNSVRDEYTNELDASASQELNQSKEHKKKKKVKQETREVNTQESGNLLNDSSFEKRQKRKTLTEGEETDVCEENVKSKKRKRHNSVKQEGSNLSQSETFSNLNDFSSFLSNSSFGEKQNHGEEEIDTNVVEKRKTKKKRQDSANLSQNQIFASDSGSDKNRRRAHSIKREIIDSERPEITNNRSFEEKKRSSIKKEKTEVETSHSVEKKKRKNSLKESLNSTDSGFIEGRDGKKSIANSTVIPGLQLPLFEFDVSGIINREVEGENDTPEESLNRKKLSFEGQEHYDSEAGPSHGTSPKKRKKTPESDAENSEFSPKKKIKKSLSDVENTETSPKKKHKKKHEIKTETNSLISDLLSKIKNEMGNSISKKKKKSGS